MPQQRPDAAFDPLIPSSKCPALLINRFSKIEINAEQCLVARITSVQVSLAVLKFNLYITLLICLCSHINSFRAD